MLNALNGKSDVPQNDFRRFHRLTPAWNCQVDVLANACMFAPSDLRLTSLRPKFGENRMFAIQ